MPCQELILSNFFRVALWHAVWGARHKGETLTLKFTEIVALEVVSYMKSINEIEIVTPSS